MKKITLIILAISFLSIAGWAQKYAYVDTKYIMDNIPEYKAAKEQLDNISVQWQKEIEAIYAEIDQMYKDYQAEKVLMNEEMKTKAENEIIEKEKEVKELQKKRFGKEGDLYKKRQELIKPIQDKVYNAVKEIAIEGNYAVIFDSSSSLTMLYTDAKYDLSDDVLEKLGYKN